VSINHVTMNTQATVKTAHQHFTQRLQTAIHSTIQSPETHTHTRTHKDNIQLQIN